MRWLCALLASFWTTAARADLPAEPEEFSTLEQRFALFEMTLFDLSDSFSWISPQTDTAMKLRGDYLRLSRTAQPEWQIASLFRAANVLERLADALDASKTPPAYSRGELVASYQDALKEKSGELRQEARLGYAEAVAKAESVGVEGRWVTLARKGESRLRRGGKTLQLKLLTRPACGTNSDCRRGYLCVRGRCLMDASTE